MPSPSLSLPIPGENLREKRHFSKLGESHPTSLTVLIGSRSHARGPGSAAQLPS